MKSRADQLEQKTRDQAAQHGLIEQKADRIAEEAAQNALKDEEDAIGALSNLACEHDDDEVEEVPPTGASPAASASSTLSVAKQPKGPGDSQPKSRKRGRRVSEWQPLKGEPAERKGGTPTKKNAVNSAAAKRARAAFTLRPKKKQRASPMK